jgi:tripeptide aminopeptidase
MKNAVDIAAQFMAMLPQEEKPQYTEGREGFYHMIDCHASCEEAVMDLIIRDHDRAIFEKRKKTIEECCDFINLKYGEGTATPVIKDQYYNMREQVEPHYKIIEIAMKAIADAGVTPKVQPIRGGTDGANLSFRGLPCPNIFAGGLNFHGKFEWVPLESMEKASQVILNILATFAAGA